MSRSRDKTQPLAVLLCEHLEAEPDMDEEFAAAIEEAAEALQEIHEALEACAYADRRGLPQAKRERELRLAVEHVMGGSY